MTTTTARTSLGHALLALALGGAAPPAASAAPAATTAPAPAPIVERGKQQKEGMVDVKEVERRFTNVQPPAAAASPAAGDQRRRPEITVEDFLRDRNRRLKAITDGQVEKMRRLCAITADDDPQKADFLFRLGELYAENQRFFSHEARALDQKIFEAPPAGKAALAEQQRAFEKSEQRWLLEAVRAFVATTRHRKYERMDQVLFKLAYLLASVKREAEAREFFHRLIKDHPTSRYISDAYLAFAEFTFEKGDMEGARRFYEKVEEFPRSSVFPYAAYKKGWCFINSGDYRAALETFVRVVRMAGEGKWAIEPAARDLLVKEARKDIVKAYAHVGGPDRARDFFRRTGGEQVDRMMEALAELYWEQGKAADSSRTYRQIISDNGDSPRLCQWQNKVLRNTLSAGDKRSQVQELQRLSAVHETLRARKPAIKKDVLDECRGAFHDVAKEVALVWHREAQRTKNQDTYALADRVYQLFLRAFPDDADAYRLGFYYGELLWTLERWREAALQYTRVVEADPRGKHVRDAAHAAVLAWRNVLAADDSKPPSRDGLGRASSSSPRAISNDQQKMIAAFHAYRRHVPDAPEVPAMIYREGYIHYDANDFDHAARLFREVVEKYPDHELGVFAANLWIDALNAQGKRKEVVAAVRRFLEMPVFMKNAQFAAEMISLMSDSFELEARDYEKQGNYKECGRSFLAAAETSPGHAKHAQRLWNTGQCFQNAHLVGQAVKGWQALIKDHPADPLAERALFRVAAGYHQLAYYSKAAEGYEEFARKFPGEPQARQALGNATAFRVGLGEGERALADMESFVRFYGARQPDEAAAVSFQMGEIYEKEQRLDDLAGHLRSYLASWGDRGGVDRQVQAHFRLGELGWRASCAHAGQRAGADKEDGACIQVKRIAANRAREVLDKARRRLGTKREQCGPPTKSQIVVFDRRQQQAASAQQHLRTAIALWRSGEAPSAGKDAEARRAGAAHAAAGAAFFLAEARYEDLLRVKFPLHLDFSKPAPGDSPRRRAVTARKLEDSNRRFRGYLDEKARLLESARQAYLDVFKLRQAKWTIAAAARIGQLHQDFAGQLYTAPIPDDLPVVDAWGNRPRDLYCDELEDQASRVESKAVESFASCLQAATQQSWFNEWSRLCERELGQLKPLEFPLSSEIKPEPTFLPASLSPTAPLPRLSPDL